MNSVTAHPYGSTPSVYLSIYLLYYYKVKDAGGIDTCVYHIFDFPKISLYLVFCKNYVKRRKGLEPMTMGLIKEVLTT